MITSGRFIEVDGSLWSADERLSYFIDDGIDEWIRSEHLLYDFERVFSPYFDLADGRHQKILKARRNEGAFYIRDLAYHFSPKELERVYLHNPKWAALEKRLYGDILTVPQEERPSLFARFRRKQKRKRTPKEMPPAMALLELADRHYHGDTAPPKSSLFWNEYHRLLADRREHPLRILELGVQNGSSLMVWQDYLPNATIVGLDVAERPERDLGERVHFVQGSQDDEDALDKAAELAGGPFDIIVDDAAHIGLLARRSFHHLFPRHLKPGGHYAIESYGTSFLPEYPDGQKFNAFPDETGTINSVEFPSHQNGMIGVVKQLIDEMNRGLATGQPSQFDISRITMLVNIAIIEKGRG
jgi:predicted O-methyltransferase YrrM